MISKEPQSWKTIVWSIVAVFGVYASMYAFRRPFSVGLYEDMPHVFLLSYKVALVIAQVMGYATSKFLGISIIASLKHQHRWKWLLLIVFLAELCWLGFALVPPITGLVFLFVNGLLLGLVYGVVFSYIEGRRMSEYLLTAIAASFVFGSGLVKSSGKMVLLEGWASERWMPFATGLLYLLPLFLFVWMLEQIPAPNASDLASRNVRVPMDRSMRKSMMKAMIWGLVPGIFFYTLLTAFRDLRDNFAADLWIALGMGADATVFTWSEIPVTLMVLALFGSSAWIKGNKQAVIFSHAVMLLGMFLVLLSTIGFQQEWVSGYWWVTFIGMGLYMAYVPFNGIYFDRLLALRRYEGNAGFLVYVADSFGYLGSVSILLYKNIFDVHADWVDFFISMSMLVSAVGCIAISWAAFYFLSGKKQNSGTGSEWAAA